MRRPASLFPIPAEHKRGFGDLDPRLAAGNMPNDANPKPAAEVTFEGDSVPPPRIIPSTLFDSRLIKSVDDVDLVVLAASRLTLS